MARSPCSHSDITWALWVCTKEGCIKDSTAKLVNLVTLEALMKQQTQWKSVDHRDAQVPWPHCRNIQGFPFQSSHWIRVWEEGVTNARHHQQKATRPARKGEKLIHGDPQNSDFLGNKIHLRPYHRFMLGLLGDLRNSMQFHVGFRGCIWKIYVLASDYGGTTRWILDNCHICKAEQGTGWSMTTRTRHLWRTRSWAPYWVWRLGFHNIPYIRFPKNMDVDSKIVKLSPTYSFNYLQSCKHILLTHQTLPSRVFLARMRMPQRFPGHRAAREG